MSKMRQFNRPTEDETGPERRSPVQLITVGPNPAWQKILRFKSLALDAVNRASALHEGVGGKGILCARAARQWGEHVACVFFAGGDTGGRLVAALEAEGLAPAPVTVSGPTRTCTTLLDSTGGSVTELIEPSSPVSPAAAAALEQTVLGLIPDADGVALCGTCPPGTPESFYASVAAAARPGCVVLIDGVKGVGPVLSAGADLLKINRAEIAALSGKENLREAVTYCFRTFRIGAIGVTDGPRPALLATPEAAWELALPELPKVVNSIGAGDTTSAVFLAEVCRLRRGRGASALPDGEDLAAAFALALAAANASCLETEPARFSRPRAEELRSEITIRQCWGDMKRHCPS